MTRRDLMASAGAGLWMQSKTGMKIQLDCGSIGVKATLPEAVDYAAKFGFEAVTADSGWLASASPAQRDELLGRMKQAGLVWGQAGLPVDFRRGEEDFQKGLRGLPERARALQQAGTSRVTTWIAPASDELTYLENFRLHARRLRAVAEVLGDHGCRFGLEYVGPKTSWSARRFPFIHTMREARELIAEVGRPNVGLVLDSWHWYTAGESVEDLRTLRAADVISIDLNDAPAGRTRDEQKDLERELPLATGVIPLADFLNTLNALGCDAPARCEPFNAALRALPPDKALAATAAAMKKAFALIR
ncbi:MAG: sugar phosphate isomerase/epimerase family protein [Bryobacteraceae bacterium]